MLTKRLKSAGLILFYLLAIGSLFEFFARLDDLITYNAPFFKVYSYETMLVDHDEFGGKGKSNGRYEKWILNSHGFRGPEISVEKPQGTIRIVTFGASETFGLYESPGKEWPNQLRDALNRLYPNKKIEVINTARAGLSLETSKDYFKNRVLKFNPDIVLYYQGFAEYMDKTVFDRKKLDRENRRENKDQTPPTGLRQAIGALITETRIYPKIKQAMKEKGPKILVKWVQAKNIQKVLDTVDKEKQNKTIDNVQVDYYREKLKDFVLFLQENNITVMLAEHDVDLEHPGVFIVLWRYHPSISAEALRKGYPIFNSTIERVAKETGSFFIEQKSLLNNPEENFAEDGVHLTDKGGERLMVSFLTVLQRVLEGKFQ